MTLSDALHWLGPGAIMTLAILCAALLRWARVPGAGWSILGGMMAGLLLGPTLFGRVMPGAYERLMIGGLTQRQARDALIRRQGVDVLAAEHARLSSEQVADQTQRHVTERAEAQRALDSARWVHQAPLRGFAWALISLLLLGSGFFAVPRGDQHQGLLAPLSIGLWSAGVPGGLAYAAMTWWWDYPPAESAMVAAGLAIGPWVLSASDRQAADYAEFGGARMIQTAGRVASLIAVAICAWALSMHTPGDSLLWAAALLALPLGWFVPLIARQKYVIVQPRLRGFCDMVVIPSLAAVVAIKIDLFDHCSFWPIVIVLLLSGDGRWMGAFAGTMILGQRRGLRTMRLVLGAMAAGPTQLAVTAVAAQTLLMPDDLLLPLLLGAALMDMTAPARNALARRLVQAEEELDELSERL